MCIGFPVADVVDYDCLLCWANLEEAPFACVIKGGVINCNLFLASHCCAVTPLDCPPQKSVMYEMVAKADTVFCECLAPTHAQALPIVKGTGQTLSWIAISWGVRGSERRVMVLPPH